MSDLEVAEVETPEEASAPDLVWGKFRDLDAAEAAYLNAQQKITSQGQELAELRALVEAYQEAEPDPEQGLHDLLAAQYDPILVAQQLAQMQARVNQAQGSPFPGLSREETLSMLADYATGQVDAAHGRAPGQLSPEQAADVAESLAAQVVPNWSEVRDQVADTIEQTPHLLAAYQDAIAKGDVTTMQLIMMSAQPGHPAANALKAAQLEAREAELGIRAKQAAQTAVGAGPGRIPSPSEQQSEWQRIVDAGRSNPWGVGMGR
jgi:hypothetical protein